METFEGYNKITTKILDLMKKILINRGDFFNIQDLSVFLRSFFIHDAMDKNILKKSSEMMKDLHLNIDQNCFAKMTINFSKNVNEKKLDKNFIKYWRKGVKILLKRGKIRGRYLDLLLREIRAIEDVEIKEKIKILLRKYKPK